MRLVTMASIIALVAAPAAGADRQIERMVARHVRAIVPPDGAGGVAVALRIEGQTLFFNYGWADRANKRPITTDTLFNLASLRKVFETTLLAQAVGNGELRLDDPVAKYVVELDRDGDIGRVTLGQLATHTSGLLLPQDHPPWPDWGYTLPEFIRTLNAWKADKAPGHQHLYTHAGYVLLRQAHRLAQRPLDRQLAEIGGEKDGHVARRGIHLARSRPVVVALLTARLADRLAFVGVALHRAARVFGGGASARAVILPRQHGRRHGERAQQPLLDQLVDRHAVSTLERELQKDIARVGIEMLLTGCRVCLPGIERADKLRQRVAPVRPGRMVLRQQQTRRVRRELAERDAADIAVPVQLDDIFGDWVVEPEFAIAHRLRQQRRLENFAQRSEIEQRVGRDRPFVGAIGPAVIEEQGLAFDAQGHRDAAAAIGRYDRANVTCDDPFGDAFGLAIGAGGGRGEERHDRCHRHESHASHQGSG